MSVSRLDRIVANCIGCPHEPIIAVSVAGEIGYWRCECGKVRETREDASPVRLGRQYVRR